jgi:Holliday junction resolvasome RuvABC endonuclease subunit
MICLSLDLGNHCGWALGAAGEVIASGTWELVAHNDNYGRRFLRFWQHLQHDFFGEAIDAIAYEDVQFMKSRCQTQLWGGYLSLAMLYAETIGVPYFGVPTGTLKAHATDNGNASKEKMIAAAIARGWLKPDSQADNEADALWVLDWALRTIQVKDNHER